MLRKPLNKYRDAIFIVTEERSCPIYNVGEEFKVETFSLTVPALKPGCLYLSQVIAGVITSLDSTSGTPRIGMPKNRFDCGGCSGMIWFELKKERDFATLQMKLLSETEERRRRQHLEKFFGILRKLDMFESLEDDSLSDFTMLLDFSTIAKDKIIIKKGDPASNLYIVLSGKVAVMADDGGCIAEMGEGEIFGEMSLLSGEPASSSIYTSTDTQVAKLSAKNFKHVLKKFPILQIFLFKLLVLRAQTMSLLAGHISSGMSGELAEIAIIDLLQLINSSQKTGRLDLSLPQGRAMVFFRDGEIIHARFLKHRNKEAIYALLRIKSGHFTYTKGVPEELEQSSSIGGFMGMLMEGLQRIDEKT